MGIADKYLYLREQSERQNRKKFDALIATPATGTFEMPANGQLAISNSAGAAEGTLALTITATEEREIYSEELEADELQIIGYHPRAATVVIESGFNVFVHTGLGVYKLIAQGGA